MDMLHSKNAWTDPMNTSFSYSDLYADTGFGVFPFPGVPATPFVGTRRPVSVINDCPAGVLPVTATVNIFIGPPIITQFMNCCVPAAGG